MCNISDILAVVRHLVLRRGVNLPRQGRLCRVVTGRLGVPRMTISSVCVVIRTTIVINCLIFTR